ncbi:TolC family protein [Geopsychrobacter electrodiphilus]|uniref:TolC family protein n=1 Tax=Geopsychrobacter electrodiphilus TaxID=225196 RepID=UPI00037F1D59|nr:TolC family protein [Geopsychrobacter electrodiphilus]
MKRLSALWVFLGLLTAGQCAASELRVPELWTAQSAVIFARQNNPDALIAHQRMLEAAAVLKKAAVGFYPQVDLSGGYSQTNNPMYSFGNILTQGEFNQGINFNDPGRTDNLELAVGVQYRIYNGGQDVAGKAAAEAGVDVSAAEQKTTRLQLEFAAYQGFQRIVEAENVVKARQSGLEAVRSSLQVAQARFDAGDLLKLDLLNLEVQESQAKETLIQSRHNLELAKKIFLTLLGLSSGEVNVDVSAVEDQVVPVDPGPDQRPELQRVNAAIQALEAKESAVRGSRLPTVDSFARYQYDQGTVLGGNGDSWLAGVKVNFKLFDGHRASADIAQVHAQLGALRAARHKLQLALGFEIAQAQLALDQAQQRLQVTRVMLEQATEGAQLSHAQFREGVILTSDLINSENRLTDARLHNVLSSSAVQVAIADLRRTAGLPQFDSSLNDQPNVENQP